MEKTATKTIGEISYEAYEGSSLFYNQFLINKILPWWSKKTIENKWLLDKTTEQLRATCLFAIFAYDNNKIIGAAGVFSFNNLSEENITCDNLQWKGKKIVELGSCFVDESYIKNHIASYFIQVRLEFVQKNNYFAFCVTSNEIMEKVNSGIAIHIERLGLPFKPLRVLIGRDCHCDHIQKLTCAVCPGDKKAISVYECCL